MVQLSSDWQPVCRQRVHMLEQVVPAEDYSIGLSLMEGCSLVLEQQQ